MDLYTDAHARVADRSWLDAETGTDPDDRD